MDMPLDPPVAEWRELAELSAEPQELL